MRFRFTVTMLAAAFTTVVTGPKALAQG